MNRALIVKELRESAVLATLAALGAAWVLANLWGTPIMPWDSRVATGLPFLAGDFVEVALPVLGWGFAVLLAMKQTAWEEMKGTFRYLMYRPVERRRVAAIKMAIGLALVMGITAALILAHAIWAATPGHHASPFFWSMTERAWQYWFVLPVVYLGAALSGWRPGKWHGSRLLPLLGAGLAAFALMSLPWWWITLAGSILVSALLAACIFPVVRTRDY
jgi:hypothetical protein